MAVPLLPPAVPGAIAVVVVAITRLRHLRREVDEAVLKGHHRGRQLERGPGLLLGLQHLIVERLARICL